MAVNRRLTLTALLAASAAAPMIGAAVAQARNRRKGDYISNSLRARVERLKQSVGSDQTNDRNYRERSLLLWEWADAYALDGRIIHPDLISAVSVMHQPSFPRSGERARLNAFQNLDRFVRTLGTLEDEPGMIGELRGKAIEPLRAGGYATLEQTYVVGSAPIKAGGGIICPNHFYFAGGEYQTEDPKADGYVTIRSSTAGARFVADRFEMTGMFSGRLGPTPSPRLFFRLSEGELRQGDRVTVVLGDRSGGSRGLKLVPWSNTALRFPVWVLTAADGHLLTPREDTFRSDGGPVIGVKGFAPSVVDVGETFELSIRAEDFARNLATGPIPAWRLMLGERVVKRIPASRNPIVVVKGLKLPEGVHRFVIVSDDGAVKGEANPILAEVNPTERILWGETHGHCGFSEGMGEVDAYFGFARDESRLDFVCLSEHDLWMDAWEWGDMRRAAKSHEAPGKFATYMGYEWTVDATFGGHHNVIFREKDGVAPVHRIRHPTLPDLYRGLRAAYKPEDVLVIPHAHMTADWTINDPGLEPIVEIVSEHGTFEWLGQKYLAEGHMVGFVGASDNHIGHPGYKTRPQGPGYTFDGYGGLAAVMAPRHDRDLIFDGLKDRRTYATNQERIILRTRMNGGRMGVVALSSPTRTISGVVHGTGPIESITLVKNGGDFRTAAFNAASGGEGPEFLEVRFFSTSFVAPKTPSRAARIWEGTLRVKGAKIVGVSSPHSETLNRLAEWVRPDAQDPSLIHVRLSTRGHAKAVRLVLEPMSGDTSVTIDLPKQSVPMTVTVPVPGEKDAPLELQSLDRDPGSALRGAGVFPDTITVKRIRPSPERDRKFSFVDETPPVDGDYYYVRVVQGDGGAAWSAPVWVGALPRRKSA